MRSIPIFGLLLSSISLRRAFRTTSLNVSTRQLLIKVRLKLSMKSDTDANNEIVVPGFGLLHAPEQPLVFSSKLISSKQLPHQT